MSGVTLHQESIGSIALDGARISVHTACALIEIDPVIPESAKLEVLHAVLVAGEMLDRARKAIPVETTSVHILEASR